MSDLGAPAFEAFFAALYGYPPFPWQSRLVRYVLEKRRWPDLLDLPTGAGKTSALDVALFALAADPESSPRRTILIVDRRVVVDQGAVHARRILEKLTAAKEGPLYRVARALRALQDAGDGEEPFAVSVMRGGMPRDDAWARRPDQAVVALSTVDQVGSRLFFRGYGVRPRMTPIHAGLIGNDALLLLDEVHLSIPFAETLLASMSWRREHGSAGCAPRHELPNRWRVVRMSATPGAVSASDEILGLSEEDRESETLDRRLRAHKRARLVPVKLSGNDETAKRAALARECAEATLQIVKGGASAVAVVVNRVDTARIACATIEEKQLGDVVLLTGRMRPLDRDRVMSPDLLARINAGRERTCEARPLIVVATQCIEAGADFDFDGLVTECASLDALRQRFGRLDRRGELGETEAVIVGRSDQIGDGADDPVYGAALARTWRWLEKQNPIDFGIDHLQLPDEDALKAMLAPADHAPLLLPAHLDAWIQTSPRPSPEPDVSAWLHGPHECPADVQVVWRADLSDALLAAHRGEEGGEVLGALLGACPPGSLEAVSLPLGAARAWLERGSTPAIADVLAAGPSPSHEGPAGADDRLVVRWAGDETCAIAPSEIAPGDTIVIPASWGGLRRDNWDPEAVGPVPDLGDLVQWTSRGRPMLRLHPAVLGTWLEPERSAAAPRVPGDEQPDQDPASEIGRWIADLPAELPSPWSEIVRHLENPRRIALPEATWALIGPRRASGPQSAEVTTEDDGASFIEAEISLAQHCGDVKRVVGGFAEGLRLAEPLAEDLKLAAWLHDVGKADPRFQRMLVGGSEVRLAILREPLAKSRGSARDVRAHELARRRAGYPRGYRHEVLSLSMIEGHKAALSAATDRDLVLYLVASHHGWCRPFPPPLDDEDEGIAVVFEHGDLPLAASTAHGLARLDSGVSDRFWLLVRRYGWWGLAWLEAILRLADHRASEEEQGGE